eukprot:TRINITY_DN6197_c0_g1_i1.p1 TRINITY_DN6197_c0_g1~~TRINITY_DN6197_c0_g1_i1.p1  ORF type:complete len:910 (-),score=209.28 TRINITY_DN6197_c0_g1_i1:32-2761(-)
MEDDWNKIDSPRMILVIGNLPELSLEKERLTISPFLKEQYDQGILSVTLNEEFYQHQWVCQRVAEFLQGPHSHASSSMDETLASVAFQQSFLEKLFSDSINLTFHFALALDHLGINHFVDKISQRFEEEIVRLQSPENIQERFNMKTPWGRTDQIEQREAIKEWQSWDVPLPKPTGENDDLTVSTVVDHKRFNVPFNHLFTKIRPRKKRDFNPDSAPEICQGCSNQFTSYLRRHHCRSCGKVYCANCLVTLNIRQTPEMKSYKTTSLYSWYVSLVTDGTLVCKRCSEELNTDIALLAQSFAVMGMQLPTLRKIALVCGKWRKAAILCLSSFREIQYYLPCQTLTPNEKKLLWGNRKYLAGHSLWMLQLVKAVDWEDSEKILELLEVLVHTEHMGQQPLNPCWETLCSSQCSQNFLPAQALELLGPNVPNKEVRCYAVNILGNATMSELLCYLPVLVSFLRYEPSQPNPLSMFLIKNALQDLQFRTYLYWALGVASECPEAKRMCEGIKNQLLSQLSSEEGQDLGVNGVEFVSIFENAYRKDSIVPELDTSKLLNLKGVRLPITPNRTIVGFQVEKVRIMNSAASPMYVPCSYEEMKDVKKGEDVVHVKQEGVMRVMFKREDLRKDYIVMNFIRMTEILLKQSPIGNQLDQQLITYSILPTSSQSGFIEMVENSVTLTEVSDGGKGPGIQAFINQHNPERKIGEISRNFLQSTAVYSVITYLLGVGDRHLGNIMITRDGFLFHIDYGWILGKEPYLKSMASPVIRITKEMVAAIGKTDQAFDQFKEFCGQIFLNIRKNSSLLYMLLELLVTASPPIVDRPTIAQLKEHIQTRLFVGYSDEDALQMLKSLLTRSQDGSVVAPLADMWHDYAVYYNSSSTQTPSLRGATSYATSYLGKAWEGWWKSDDNNTR